MTQRVQAIPREASRLRPRISRKAFVGASSLNGRPCLSERRSLGRVFFRLGRKLVRRLGGFDAPKTATASRSEALSGLPDFVPFRTDGPRRRALAFFARVDASDVRTSARRHRDRRHPFQGDKLTARAGQCGDVEEGFEVRTSAASKNLPAPQATALACRVPHPRRSQRRKILAPIKSTSDATRRRGARLGGDAEPCEDSAACASLGARAAKRVQR